MIIKEIESKLNNMAVGEAIGIVDEIYANRTSETEWGVYDFDNELKGMQLNIAAYEIHSNIIEALNE